MKTNLFLAQFNQLDLIPEREVVSRRLDERPARRGQRNAPRGRGGPVGFINTYISQRGAARK